MKKRLIIFLFIFIFVFVLSSTSVAEDTARKYLIIESGICGNVIPHFAVTGFDIKNDDIKSFTLESGAYNAEYVIKTVKNNLSGKEMEKGLVGKYLYVFETEDGVVYMLDNK